MKKIIILSCLCFVSHAFGQWKSKTIKGTGPVMTKEINTNSYEGVSVTGSFYVSLIKGTEGKIIMKAQENLLDYISISVENKELAIRTKKGFNLTPAKGQRIEIIVPIEEISSIKLAGSGDIVSSAELQTSRFNIDLVGSGDIKLNINCETLVATLSGSGDIELKGKAKTVEATVAGSGDIEAFDVLAENAKASVAGSGDIEVSCSERIEAYVSGSGDIKYRGNPKKQDTKVTGSGTIKMD